MSKRATLPQSRYHIWIVDADLDWLRERYDTPGTVIRDIVHQCVEKWRAEDLKAGDGGAK